MTDRAVDTSRQFNARLAGFTLLFYFVVGITSMVLLTRATDAEGTAAMLARIAGHAFEVRVAILLELLECFSALALAVTFYKITRDEDPTLAMLAAACRVGEGVFVARAIPNTLGLLWLATAGAGAGAPDAATAHTLGAFLLMPSQYAMIGSPFFAVGSMIFSYLMLRGRIVPAPLAWLGVLASVLLVVGEPLQLVGFLHGPVIWCMRMPALVFQVTLGPWLLIKGVASRAAR